ncbi:hypothetical protein GZ998_10425 [Actinomyces sp. 594]|uniref:hypothetical protein n=1 Tax=Actinomyces sp. 594 TaxID=2057793 RepID=UPI001C57D3A8|nr:hypothetical protein [Actinomyces sp. 594]MBW3069911.1 hypothetical protein [Actinomyces sp. 594]
MPAMFDLRRTLAALVAVAMSAALIVFSFIISDTAATQMTAARLRCRARPPNLRFSL